MTVPFLFARGLQLDVLSRQVLARRHGDIGCTGHARGAYLLLFPRKKKTKQTGACFLATLLDMLLPMRSWNSLAHSEQLSVVRLNTEQ